jgi:hypothetical protein
MWVVLFLIAEVFLIIWTAVILLILRDKVLGHRLPEPTWDDEEFVAKPTPVPRWRRWLFVPFAPLAILVFPVLLVILLVIAAPLAAWNLAIHSFYWLRSRATGKPMPPFGLLPEDLEDPLQDAPGRC